MALVAWIHVALSSTDRILTAHMLSNRNINISTGNNYVMGIQQYTCSNNPCNMKSDPHDKNIKIINACIPVNTCNSDIRT